VNAVFFNHSTARCGVYQMGHRIGTTLAAAGVATYMEIATHGAALDAMASLRPRVAIYNWHPSTIPWAPDLVRRFTATKHVGLMHEISPENMASGADVFPYRIVSDPSFPADGHTLFRSTRHVPRSSPPGPNNEVMTIGSFGFAVGGKMFHAIVQAVAQEFPGARVRLRIPSAHYGDDAGALARHAADGARSVMGSVTLEIEHDFLGEDALVRWLGGNDLNVFFYDYNPGRGISSVLDYAIAARRPIAINGSQMFRHVLGRLGAYPERRLVDALDSARAIEDLYQAWNPDRLAQDYRDMLAAIG
jgi:hypothetical protein